MAPGAGGGCKTLNPVTRVISCKAGHEHEHQPQKAQHSLQLRSPDSWGSSDAQLAESFMLCKTPALRERVLGASTAEG